MLAREHSQPRILRHPRVGRARLALEQKYRDQLFDEYDVTKVE